MIATPSRKPAIFVASTCAEYWIVRDPNGIFWMVPHVDNAWDRRVPFEVSENTKLTPVPGHYKHMLGLPF